LDAIAGEAEMLMAAAAAAAWPCRDERDRLADEDGESERAAGDSVLEADDVGVLESLAGCLP
jgi:hypothetical protein